MLEARFPRDVDEVEVIGLTQWDRGQTIQITTEEGLPTIYQAQFTFKGSNKALSVQVLDNAAVEIPNELLTQPKDLVAYVYLIGEDGSGETIKTISLPVVPRAKPEDYTEIPASVQERVEAMLATINTKADTAVQTASNAKTVAEQSASVSAQSAANAAASAAAAEKSAADAVAATNLNAEQIAALMGDIDCGTFVE